MKELPIEYNTLTPEEEYIILHKGTERPFGENYEKFKGEGAGTYICRQCNAPLYRSSDKFSSHCGWPSFDDELPNAVAEENRAGDPEGSEAALGVGRRDVGRLDRRVVRVAVDETAGLHDFVTRRRGGDGAGGEGHGVDEGAVFGDGREMVAQESGPFGGEVVEGVAGQDQAEPVVVGRLEPVEDGDERRVIGLFRIDRREIAEQVVMVEIDGVALGAGKPGPLAARLREIYLDASLKTSI